MWNPRKQAADLYKRARARNPTDVRVLSNLGALYAIEGSDEQAMEVLMTSYNATEPGQWSSELLANLATLYHVRALLVLYDIFNVVAVTHSHSRTHCSRDSPSFPTSTPVVVSQRVD
jgi:hypothetical protein